MKVNYGEAIKPYDFLKKSKGSYRDYYYKYKALKYYLKNRSIIIKGGTNNSNCNQKHEILFSIETAQSGTRTSHSMYMDEIIENIYKNDIIPDYLISDKELDNLKQQLDLNYKETPPHYPIQITDKWWIKGSGLHRFYIRNEIKKYIQNEGYENIILPEMKLLFYDYENKEYKNSAEEYKHNDLWNEITNVLNFKPSFLLLLEHVDTSDDNNKINDKAKDEMSKLLSVFRIDIGDKQNLYITNDGKVVLIDVEYTNSKCSDEKIFRTSLTKYYGSNENLKELKISDINNENNENEIENVNESFKKTKNFGL